MDTPAHSERVLVARKAVVMAVLAVPLAVILGFLLSNRSFLLVGKLLDSALNWSITAVALLPLVLSLYGISRNRSWARLFCLGLGLGICLCWLSHEHSLVSPVLTALLLIPNLLLTGDAVDSTFRNVGQPAEAASKGSWLFTAQKPLVVAAIAMVPPLVMESLIVLPPLVGFVMVGAAASLIGGSWLVANHRASGGWLAACALPCLMTLAKLSMFEEIWSLDRRLRTFCLLAASVSGCFAVASAHTAVLTVLRRRTESETVTHVTSKRRLPGGVLAVVGALGLLAFSTYVLVPFHEAHGYVNHDPRPAAERLHNRERAEFREFFARFGKHKPDEVVRQARSAQLSSKVLAHVILDVARLHFRSKRYPKTIRLVRSFLEVSPGVPSRWLRLLLAQALLARPATSAHRLI